MPTPPHLAAALNALSTHAPRYTADEAFYNGTVPEVIASHRLRELLGNTGDAFRINYARTAADVLLERTLIQGITVSDVPSQELIAQAWQDNELGLEAKDVHRRVYEFGDSYLIGWPDEDVPSGVSFFSHDPRSVRVFYDPAYPRRKSHAIHFWYEQGSDENGLRPGVWWRANLYYPDRVEFWVSSAPVDDGTGTVKRQIADVDMVPYTEDGQTDDGVVDNPTPGVIPVFHFRNGRPYGRSEMEDAKGPQNMINKLLITMMASVDYAGFPQRYVTTDSALDPSPSNDAFAPPPDDSIDIDSGLRDDSSMEAGPGSTWILSGSKVGVGQFQTADTNNFLNAVHSIIKQMAAVTDTPMHYFDRSGQMPSGESFRMAEVPLNKKLSDRLALLGVTWHEVFEYVLRVNGRASSDAQVAWAPPHVFTDKDSWETAKLQLEAGVDPVTVFTERGYSVELAQEWAQNRAQAPTA